MIKEFATKVGLIGLVKMLFKTNDTTSARYYTDSDNLMQVVYQIFSAYFKDCTRHGHDCNSRVGLPCFSA